MAFALTCISTDYHDISSQLNAATQTLFCLGLHLLVDHASFRPVVRPITSYARSKGSKAAHWRAPKARGAVPTAKRRD